MSNDDARQARVERAAEVINRSLVRQVHDEVVEIIADEGLEVERTVARALDDAGMLADTAGQDADECPKCGCPTRCAEGELAKAWNIVRRQERTIEGYERSAVNADELRRRAERAEAEAAELRATVARVRALADRYHRYREFRGFNITASDVEKRLRAAFDGQAGA